MVTGTRGEALRATVKLNETTSICCQITVRLTEYPCLFLLQVKALVYTFHAITDAIFTSEEG